MHIYFSGVGGVGIGPLAEIAHDAGYQVSGSDVIASPMTDQLRARDIEIAIGQDGSHIRNRHDEDPIDWFVYSSALPDDHPELQFARRHNIRISKRDELLAHIIDEKSLRLIAIAGTHGKTTTTAMAVWLCKKLGVPVSYSIGSTLSFGPSGFYDPDSQIFIYECDEYDRNFLHFYPYLSLLTSLDHDHPDTFPTVESYKQAFLRFIHQSQTVLAGPGVAEYLETKLAAPPAELAREISLPGDHTRENAALAVQAIAELTSTPLDKLVAIMSSFPGTGRRFEKLAENLYSDYGHHPAEIAATLQMARELSDHVVLVYQPHQNRRQHEVKEQYVHCAELAEKIYWLPTYLTREDEAQAVLTPDDLTAQLTNRAAVTIADLDYNLWNNIQQERAAGKLVLIMGAGTIDSWVRAQLAKTASTI